MKRAGDLWANLVSWANLDEAARRAALGKKRRSDVGGFLMRREDELARLHLELTAGVYRPGPYRSFVISDPKRRLISAAPFRDRVVHHALTQVLEPIFERRFLSVSHACRVGRGVHTALAVAREAAREHRFVLKCDVKRYFASLDHQILCDQLARVVKCAPTLELARRIVEGSNPQEPVHWCFPGDDPVEADLRRRGLPLGNQTSQFFANVYLNGLDHFVCRQLYPARYARYVDDLVLFGDSAHKLEGDRRAIEEFLAGVRLRLHETKSRVYRVKDGFTFLGWRILPDHMRLVRSNVVHFRRRMKWMHAAWNNGEIEWEDIRSRVAAWNGQAMHGDTWTLRQQIMEQFPFVARPREPPRLPDPASIPPGTFPDDLFDKGKPGKTAALAAWFDVIMKAGCHEIEQDEE